MTTEMSPAGEGNRDQQLALAAQRSELQRLHEIAGVRREDQEEQRAIDLLEYWNVLRRRKWTIIAVLTISLVVALVVTFNATPIYRSTLLLNIDLQSDRVVEYQNVSATENSSGSWEFYQTQYELLRSRSLARRVVNQLGLEAAVVSTEEDDPSFFSALMDTFGGLGGSNGDASDLEPEDGAGDDAKRSGAAAEDVLLANLEVAPIKDSRLVRIHFQSADPEEAAAVANAMAENFVNSTLERRFDSNSYAKKFLDERIAQVRANLEDSERRLVVYARERKIVNLDDRLENLLQMLREMNSQLVAAESDRIRAESKYEEFLEEGGTAMAGVLGNPVIQSLKARRVGLETEYQEQLKIYKPGYPKMQQIKGQIDEIDKEIRGEIAAIGKSVKIDYDGNVRRQASLQTRIAEVKSEILALQDRSTDYQTLKREVETNRELYDGLLQRLKEIGVVAGIGTNNISIIDRAEIPIYPYKPNLQKNLVIAMGFGLIAGIMMAFVFELLDDTVKTSEEVEKRVGAPVLGVIPLTVPEEQELEKEELGLIAFKDPKSPMAEAVRSLRASLIFATSDGAPKIMHFTSSGPGEGKTTTATSTAITFAQAGSKVLLIDADLRDPTLHRSFSLPNTQGLTNYLAGSASPAEIARPTEVTGLFTVTSGPLPPNPVELLSSAKMIDLLGLASERFDCVILDGPPVIGLADALVLANLANATIFVVEVGATRSGALEGAIRRLRAANAVMLGSVLAKFRRAGRGYGYGYGYDYHYSYSYGGNNQTTALPKQA